MERSRQAGEAALEAAEATPDRVAASIGPTAGLSLASAIGNRAFVTAFGSPAAAAGSAAGRRVQRTAERRPGRQTSSRLLERIAGTSGRHVRAIDPVPHLLAGQHVLALQRAIGNRATAGLLGTQTGKRVRLLQRAGPATKPTGAADAGTKPPEIAFPVPPDVLAQYLDERVANVAVNLMQATVFVELDSGEEVQIPLGQIVDERFELVPMFPVRDTLEGALAGVPADWAKEIQKRGQKLCVFYRGPGKVVWPSILNEQTLPRLTRTYRLALEAAREGARATAKTGEHLLLWYIGARFPVKTRHAPASTGVRAGPAAGAFNAAKVADELVAATSQLKSPGQMMVAAAKQLSGMGGISAAQKVEVILEFFRRIGFITSKEGVLAEKGYYIMHSEDYRYAFKILQDSGKILYGKFDIAAADYVWTVL
jgi:hypothetical protein